MSQIARTVLIVNDSLLERKTYRCYLQQETSFAYTVWEAESTEAALQLCGKQLPDCIVLDYLLPDRDGLEFLVELKTCIGENCPPVIMLNDRGNEAIAIQAFKAGVEDYLIKQDITAESLRYITRKAIENFQLRWKLSKSEERFRTSIENMLDCFGIYTAIRERDTGAIVDFRIDYLNAAALKSNSMTADDIGKPLCELFPAHHESGLFAEYCRALETGEPFVKDCLIYSDRFGDRDLTRAYNVQVRKLDDGFVASWRDITEQKHCEVSLRQSEERYRAIVDNQTELICRFSPDYTLTFVNQSYSSYFGSTPTALIGQNFLNLIPESDRAAVQQQIAELSTAEPENAVMSLEHLIFKPNGEISIQQWTNRAIFDRNGQLIEFQAVGRDITDLKQAEEALRESERKFSAVFDQTFELIGLLSLDGILLEVNQAALDSIGVQQCDIVGQWFWETPWWTHSRSLQDRLRDAISEAANGKIIRYEVNFPIPNGDTMTTDFSLKPVVDEIGRVVMLIAEGRDLTARKRTEAERDALLTQAQAAREEAEEANRSKDEFVAVVAHELRSPINSVAGWAQLLRMRKFDAATIDRALEAIERGTQTQVQLIEDLLDISRMACGTLRLTFAPVDLVMVIKAAVSLVRPMAEAKQIHVDTQLTANAWVSGDLNRLQQIVVNLLANAIKFTPSMGRVTIILERIDRRTRIQVSDTGKGINPEFLPNIFEQFQQGQKNSGSKDGLGLGLAIVKNLVEMHNGTITADSLGIGQGATFTVWLPLLESEFTINTEEMPIAPDAASLAGIRILAVDDEPDSLELLQFILEEAGAEVRTAASGSIALDLLPEIDPSLIISDIAMPDMNGHELLQQIRKLYPDRPIPAIALTAYASSSDRDYSLRIGFERYFSKPVEPEVLVAEIVSLIRESN
jgi:PAS domain S-box-containing protein